MNRYNSIATYLNEGKCNFIKTFDSKSAKRIINRAMSKGWWFTVWQCEGEWHIAFSSALDLEKDLRCKLAGLKFEID